MTGSPHSMEKRGSMEDTMKLVCRICDRRIPWPEMEKHVTQCLMQSRDESSAAVQELVADMEKYMKAARLDEKEIVTKLLFIARALNHLTAPSKDAASQCEYLKKSVRCSGCHYSKTRL